jgi:hypothetical protein
VGHEDISRALIGLGTGIVRFRHKMAAARTEPIADRQLPCEIRRFQTSQTSASSLATPRTLYASSVDYAPGLTASFALK